jgi:subtilase family serine protease
VTFTGSASQIETSFRTPIHEYVVDGETFYANADDPSIPDALSNLVLGFRSLNNFRLKARARKLRVNPNPQFTSSTSGNHFLAPADFATIYNLNGLYASGLDGSGQKIAIMGQTNIDLNDIRAFRSASGLEPNDPEVILVPGSSDPGTNNDDLGEADLDLEWAGAVARNAHLIYVNSNDGVFDSLQYTIDQNLAPVVSISYGSCERNFAPRDINMLLALGQQASAQGITIVAASGDSGAADCDYNVRTATRGLAVDIPASLPNVTGLGGSQFRDGENSWSPTNNAMSGSALSYISETTWNDNGSNVLSAGGGGRSIYFAKPEWQAAPGVPNDQARDVPDISLTASAQHVGYLVCSLGSCVSGFRATDGTLNVAGGTSAAAPTFAGIVALLNQAANSRQGNVNPGLYRLASIAPAVFHDIDSGGNQVPCRLGTTNCPNGGTIGYTAAAGYDLATGLGSIDALGLIASWPMAVTTVTPPTTPATGGPNPTESSTGTPQPITSVEQGSTRSGYVVVTPDANSTVPVAAATFGIVSNGIVQAQAGILPTGLTTSSTLLINVAPSIGRNLGVAIANPGTSANGVTLTLQDANGAAVATATVQIPARQQISRFVSELFASAVGTAFTGSLRLQSQAPFSVAALRFSGIEFSTLPIIGGAAGGGSSPIVIPQFALGGGWTTEIALFNNSSSAVSGQVDVFDANGNPMAVPLNNSSQSTFRYSIPAGGTLILSPRDANGQTPL